MGRIWAAVVALTMVLSARGGEQPPAPQFETRVELIRVDASVLDRERRPVRSLGVSDFVILENGKAQRIESFVEVSLPEPEPGAAPWTSEIPPDVQRNDDPGDHRLIVLVFDDAMLPPGAQVIRTAKAVGNVVVDRLGAGDLAAVVFTRDSRGTQGFTSDRARLRAAVDRLGVGQHEPRNLLIPDRGMQNLEKARGFDSVRTLRAVLRTLQSVPERRKSLVFVSIGLPLDLAATGPGADPADPTATLFEELKQAFREARDANVNIYPVDPAGLDGVRIYLERGVPASRFEVETRENQERVAAVSRSYRDFLRTLADNTGGHAFVDSNEVEERMAEVFRETGTFYLLGYRSSDPKPDGRFRRIQVRVNQRGLTVRARSGYWAPGAPTGRLSLPAPATVAAIEGLLPRFDVPLRLLAVPLTLANERDPVLSVHVGLPSTTRPETFNVLVNAYRLDGRLADSQRITASGVPASVPGSGTGYELMGRLKVTPDTYEVRVAAESIERGRAGSVYAVVEVGDHRQARLAVSGPVIEALPSLIQGSTEPFGSLIPLIPTLRRTFASSERVRAFVRIHQGGGDPPSPATISVHILNGNGTTVFDLPRRLGSDEFSRDGSYDYLFDIPVSRLTTGPHLLEVETRRRDTTLIRHVRFEVR